MATNRRTKRKSKERAEADVELCLEDGWKQEDLDGLDDSTFDVVVATIKRATAEANDDEGDEDSDDDSGDDDAQGADDEGDEDSDDDSGDDDAQGGRRTGGPRMRDRRRTGGEDERTLRQEAEDFGQTIPAGTF